MAHVGSIYTLSGPIYRSSLLLPLVQVNIITVGAATTIGNYHGFGRCKAPCRHDLYTLGPNVGTSYSNRISVVLPGRGVSSLGFDG